LIFKKKENLVSYIKNKQIPLLVKNDIYHFYYEFMIYGGYPEVVLEDDIEEKKNILEEI